MTLTIRTPTDEQEEEWLDLIEERSHSAYALVVERDGRKYALKLMAKLDEGESLISMRDELIALSR